MPADKFRVFNKNVAVRLVALCLLLASGRCFAEFSIDQVELRAQLSPVRFTTLSAEFGARLISLSVREGEEFKEGQELIRFDCSLQRAQLVKARAELAGAKNLYQGNQKLAQLGAIGQVELRGAQIEVQKAQADIGYLQTLLDKCSLVAPFDGRVGMVSAMEQQFVQPGQPLLEIFDDRALELSFIVPSRWLAWFKPGYMFSVAIDETGRQYPAKLMRTAGKADPVSQSVRAFAIIEGKHSNLIAGMSGRLLIAPPE